LDVAASEEAGEGVGPGGPEECGGGVRAVWAVVAGARGVVVPVGVRFRPEVDFCFMALGGGGEEVAVGYGFEGECGEPGGGGELFAVGEDVLVVAVVPFGFGEEDAEIRGHGERLR